MKNNIFDMKTKLSTLWIVVMFNMLFADVFSIIVEIVNGGILDIPADVNIMMTIATILVNIPIFMIFLSKSLPYKLNRIANITAGIFTIIFVIGGGHKATYYITIATIEVILLLTIVINAYKWKPEMYNRQNEKYTFSKSKVHFLTEKNQPYLSK